MKIKKLDANTVEETAEHVMTHSKEDIQANIDMHEIEAQVWKDKMKLLD